MHFVVKNTDLSGNLIGHEHILGAVELLNWVEDLGNEVTFPFRLVWWPSIVAEMPEAWTRVWSVVNVRGLDERRVVAV